MHALMRTLRAAVLLTLFLALGVLPLAAYSAPARAARVTECGNGGSLYGGQVRVTNVTSRGVRCASARGFARAFIFSGGPACNEDRYCRFRGYDCLSYGRGARIDTRCTTGSRVVRWQWGS
jgi:hypothetical protein